MQENSGNLSTRVTINGQPLMLTAYNRPDAWTSVATALCPDLLCYEQIGEADNLRGRVVRAFFWLMRAWPT